MQQVGMVDASCFYAEARYNQRRLRAAFISRELEVRQGGTGDFRPRRTDRNKRMGPPHIFKAVIKIHCNLFLRIACIEMRFLWIGTIVRKKENNGVVKLSGFS